ncbi:DNA polymerase alpha catalytic subunit [Cryptosporidium xiaoi]|uniref:DNA polymerase n=1 Tax=Cryptosporidium xiaoi TaxID=659607 RepID=A0AAV9XXH5_9CRYT
MRSKNLRNAQGALSEIRKIREGKIKASEAYTLKDNNIYEEVDEEEYQNIIRERRINDFVVDDDCMGYEDDGTDLMENYIFIPEEDCKRYERKRKKGEKKHLNGLGSIIKQFQFEDKTKSSEMQNISKVDDSKNVDLLNTLKNFDDALFEDIEPQETKANKESCQKTYYSPHLFNNERSDEKLSLIEANKNNIDKLSPADIDVFVINENEVMAKSIEVESRKDKEEDGLEIITDVEIESNVGEKGLKHLKLSEVNMFDKADELLISNPVNSGTNIVDCQDNLSFYIMEITEDANTGELFLFGKLLLNNNLCGDSVPTENCCVVIKETWRTLYVYPRESMPNHPDPITASQNVAKEMLEIRKIYKIPKLQMKPVTRNFCFSDKDVLYGPNQPFLKVLYSSKYPALPSNISGETFSRIFGTNTSLIENFIVKRGIKGPSWIKIMKPYQIIPVGGGRKSQCKYEIHIQNWKVIRPWNSSLVGTNHSNSNNTFGDNAQTNTNKISVSIKGDGSAPSPPLSTLLCINVNSKLSPESSNSEIYSICMVGLKNVNIDDICWDDYNASDLVQGKISSFSNIQLWTGIRRASQSLTFPVGSEEKMEKAGIKYFSTERSLLVSFITAFSNMDPDIIVGHNIWIDHLDILVNRLMQLNIPNSWKLGKIFTSVQNQKISMKSSSSTKRIQTLFQGRLICDTCLSSREFMKSRVDYQLNTIFSDIFSKDYQLKKASERPDSSEDFLNNTYKNYDSIFKALFNELLVSVGVFKLLFHLQVLPLTRELTNLAGFLWSKSLLFLRAERNEYLLLHEFHKGKFVAPDLCQKNHKQKQKGTTDESVYVNFDKEQGPSKKEDGSYSGGLVLEPITGLYESFVLLLDFNSLYPSIIQEFNICFTTREPTENDSEDKYKNGNTLSFENTILPGVLESLVKRRRHIKEILKGLGNGTRRTQLEIRQLALKLTANSIYGCLGYKNSRFYAKELAAVITHYGRQILEKTKNKVENEIKLQVIYGDTDSIMVNTNIIDDGKGEGYNNAVKLATQIKHVINKDYSKLELDLDGVLRRLLLLKKKKYACIQIIDYNNKHTKLDCKGLDLVRRDWSILTRNVSMQILNLIFSDETLENVITSILSTLEMLNESLNSNSIPLESYVITKTLTKLPQHYSDPFLLPHVIVAKRMISEGLPVTSGTEIPYIICKEIDFNNNQENQNKNSSLSGRAYSIEEVKSKNLNIDIEWYKSQQILPPISRLCSPIPGLEISRIGQCLGLEYRHYSEIIQKEDLDKPDNEFTTFEWKKNPDKYMNVPITAHIACLKCLKQGNNDVNRNIFENLKENKWICNECGDHYPVEYLSNWLNIHLRMLTLSLYSAYNGYCRECNTKTRRISFKNAFNCPQSHCKTHKSLVNELTPHKIWLYLDHWLYWLTQVDENSGVQSNVNFNDSKNVRSTLRDIIINFMNINRYNHIQVNDLFTMLSRKDKYRRKALSGTTYQNKILTVLWGRNNNDREYKQ